MHANAEQSQVLSTWFREAHLWESSISMEIRLLDLPWSTSNGCLPLFSHNRTPVINKLFMMKIKRGKKGFGDARRKMAWCKLMGKAIVIQSWKNLIKLTKKSSQIKVSSKLLFKTSSTVFLTLHWTNMSVLKPYRMWLPPTILNFSQRYSQSYLQQQSLILWIKTNKI